MILHCCPTFTVGLDIRAIDSRYNDITQHNIKQYFIQHDSENGWTLVTRSPVSYRGLLVSNIARKVREISRLKYNDYVSHMGVSEYFNTLRPTQNSRHIADNIFKCIFVNEHLLYSDSNFD